MINVNTKSVSQSTNVDTTFGLDELSINEGSNSIRIYVNSGNVTIEASGTKIKQVTLSFNDFYNLIAS
jgi:hypothetical protein